MEYNRKRSFKIEKLIIGLLLVNSYSGIYGQHNYKDYSFYGNSLESEKKYKEAIVKYDSALIYASTKKDSALILYKIGRNLHFSNKTKQAIKILHRSLRLDSDNAQAMGLMGFLYGFLGDYDQALSILNSAINIDSSFIDNYYYRGLVNTLLYNFPKAIEDFDNYIINNSNYAKAYYDRGAAKLGTQKLSDACADFKKALELGYEDAERVINEYCNDL